MTMLSNHVLACPRCGGQIAGWLVRDSDNYVHCVHCGAVIRDEGYKSTSFKTLFATYAIDRRASNYYLRNQVMMKWLICLALRNHPNPSRRLTMRIFRNVVKTVKLAILGAVVSVIAFLAGASLVKKYSDNRHPAHQPALPCRNKQQDLFG